VRASLLVALAWGYCTPESAEEALARVDRVLAMMYRLTH
jgi:hypothetical protein